MNLDAEMIDNGITKVSLDGRLDIEGNNDIETEFTALGHVKKAKILVDLTDVSFIASIGMRTFLRAATALSDRKGKMVLVNAQPLVQEALASAGIDSLIPMHDEMEAAVASLAE